MQLIASWPQNKSAYKILQDWSFTPRNSLISHLPSYNYNGYQSNTESFSKSPCFIQDNPRRLTYLLLSPCQTVWTTPWTWALCKQAISNRTHLWERDRSLYPQQRTIMHSQTILKLLQRSVCLGYLRKPYLRSIPWIVHVDILGNVLGDIWHWLYYAYTFYETYFKIICYITLASPHTPINRSWPTKCTAAQPWDIRPLVFLVCTAGVR